MAKSKNRIVYYLLLLVINSACVSKTRVSDTVAAVKKDSIAVVQPVAPSEDLFVEVHVEPPIDLVDQVRRAYTSQIGVRERTGHNDGLMVETYLRSVGLGKGNPWCAAFVHYCLERGGVPNSINGYSPTAFNTAHKIWFARKRIKDLQAGDVFCLYFPSLKRIAHTGFYDRTINNSIYETVEGNTNEEGSREGDGVYRKKRSFNATYVISRWIPQ